MILLPKYTIFCTIFLFYRQKYMLGIISLFPNTKIGFYTKVLCLRIVFRYFDWYSTIFENGWLEFGSCHTYFTFPLPLSSQERVFSHRWVSILGPTVNFNSDLELGPYSQLQLGSQIWALFSTSTRVTF